MRLVQAHTINRDTQIRAWCAQIELLRRALKRLPASWHLLLEYPLLRLARRIDAVLLTGSAVLVFEFKIGAKSFTNVDRQQVEDYALDLHDFHAESRTYPIVPILVATDATPRATIWPLLLNVTPVLDASAATLPDLLHELAHRIRPADSLFNPAKWETAPYRPVPTIVEAATMLYTRRRCRQPYSNQ
jgi:hypothetical protein